MDRNTKDTSVHGSSPLLEAGRFPDFVILGAMKCGTTSLHDYLGYHPDVSMSQPKELNFFVKHQRWERGIEWYKRNFTKVDKIMGESSPNYTRHPLFPGVPERMYEVMPDAKLIYCVRDPIRRMVSHYVHTYSIGEEDRSFAEAALAEEENAYLWCSLYYYQLKQYLKYYSALQIKVVVLEDLKARPQETLEEVFEFLGVDATYQDTRFMASSGTMPPAKTRRRNFVKSWMRRNNMRGVYWLERNIPWVFGAPIKSPKVDEALRQKLTEKLRGDVEALREFTGLELASWTSFRPEKAETRAPLSTTQTR